MCRNVVHRTTACECLSSQKSLFFNCLWLWTLHCTWNNAGWLHDWEKTMAEIASSRNDSRWPAGAACRVRSSRVCVRASLSLVVSLCRSRTVSERGEDLSIERVWGQSCDGRVCLFALPLCSVRVLVSLGRTSHRSTVEKWLFLLVCLLVLVVTCLVCHGLS